MATFLRVSKKMTKIFRMNCKKILRVLKMQRMKMKM